MLTEFSKTYTVSSEAKLEKLNLNGAGVLITRPIELSAGIESLVLQQGGVPHLFPTLEIRLSPADELQPHLARIGAGDILIFVSTNAVRGVFRTIGKELHQRLTSAQLAAVGDRTQAALADEGMFVAITPGAHQQNTEGLLQHPLLQELHGNRVFIVRAQSGRQTLGDELMRRGARLEYIQAYQRRIPLDYDVRPVIRALETGRIQCVMLTSHDAFENLSRMLGERACSLLKGTQLLVPSQRIADKILTRDTFSVSVANNASDEEMLLALGKVL